MADRTRLRVTRWLWPRPTLPRLSRDFEENVAYVNLTIYNRNAPGLDDELLAFELELTMSGRAADWLDWLLPDSGPPWTRKGWMSRRSSP